LIGPSAFPAAEAPGGMDFWPQDGSLLVTTSQGRIVRFATNGTRLPDFASNLGNGKFKIRAGYESSVPLAVVANNNGGQILKFGTPPATGTNVPLATVTKGVQHPQGVVVSNVAATATSTCLQSAGGCNVLGNVLKHTVSNNATANGSIIEEPCVVQVDPRIKQYGTCKGHSLSLAGICAGYDDIVIPDYLCGGSGSSGKGFALVDTTTTGTFNTLNAIVTNESFSENIIGTPTASCPVAVLGWAPKADEGTIVEGHALLELTGACGSSVAFSRKASVWGIGLVLDVNSLPGKNASDKMINFAASKYDAISATITAVSTSIADPTETQLLSCLDTSRTYFDRKKYLNAASQLLVCDQIIAQNPASFGSASQNPNPSGELRGRLANLYLTINTRILGNTPNTAWPPTN
jgi:hypothetical protein